MTVILDHVGKTYGGRAVVSDLSYALEPGQVVALVGLLGSGKSRLAEILYGMAREDVVPAPFAKVSSRQVPWLAILFSVIVIAALLVSGADLAQLANVTVVFTLLIYALVIVSAVKLDRHDRTDETFRAPRVLLGIGVVANFLILGYVIYDDPGSLLYCAALLGVGVVLFIAERVLGSGTPTTDLES